MHKTTTNKLILRTALFIAIIGVLLWYSVKNRIVTVKSEYRMTMGTVARIVVTAESKKEGHSAIDTAFETIFHVDKLMNDYDPDSQLSQVNREAFNNPVPVDAELFDVLTAAKLYSCTTDGAFDVTIGPVVQLWRKANAENAAPAPEALEKAKEAVGQEKLILNPEDRTVQFAKEGMFLDLGGIAKGYAIDKAVEVLQSAGMAGGMVDIGGDLRCFGTPAGHAEHWLIGVQDPKQEENILMKLKIDNMAVATSGDYRRFVMIDDEKHSHIINPATADSAADLSSVTVLTPTAMAADALATAVTVLGNQKGLELIEKTENTEAVLISHGDETSFEKTSGVEQYIQK